MKPGNIGEKITMNQSHRRYYYWAMPLAICLAWAAHAQEPVLTYEPSQIIENESENCAECHENAVAAWERSHHKTTYDELHLRDEAAAILERMDMSGSIRRNSECTQCHYTLHADEPGGRAKPVMGVSCQRCHGAARDWLEIHQAVEETPSRMERLKEAESKGMRPTYSVYNLASSCYQCHTVPREALVNQGEHPASSKDFNLVAWANGEVRHNFLQEPGADGNRADTKEIDTNRDISPETAKVFAVMGEMIDLEYSLRGLALATEEGTYLEAMGDRVARAYASLKGMNLNIDPVKKALSAVPMDGGSPKIAMNNSDEYTSAADAIREAAMAFDKDTASFASALSSISPTTEYRGSAYKE